MKLRICLILLFAALVLSSFEIWRYQTANKNFKYLYETKSAEQSAFFSAFRAYNSLLIELQDSGLLGNKLNFDSSQLFSSSGSNYNQTSISVGALCFIEFSIKTPLSSDDINEIDFIAKNFKEKLPPKWNFHWKHDEGFVRFNIQTDSQRFYEPWSRFPSSKK